jgi:hypothetical protein
MWMFALHVANTFSLRKSSPERRLDGRESAKKGPPGAVAVGRDSQAGRGKTCLGRRYLDNNGIKPYDIARGKQESAA